jgi:hypothetical protein
MDENAYPKLAEIRDKIQNEIDFRDRTGHMHDVEFASDSTEQLEKMIGWYRDKIDSLLDGTGEAE